MSGPRYIWSDDKAWPISKLAIAFTLSLHLGLFVIMLFVPAEHPIEVDDSSLNVVLIEAPGSKDMAVSELPLQEPIVISPPAPASSKPLETVDVEPLTEPDTVPESPLASEQIVSPEILQSAQPATGETGELTAPKSHIPSRWALKPPLAKGRLQSLGFGLEDIECLRSLDEDCKGLRQEVFAQYQLTETQLVWTANRPDTGLPAPFYGLTDREIRSKLGVANAGENGFFLPFSNIGLGGPLVDKMFGVNKNCKSVPGVDPQTGQMGAHRKCD